MLNDSNYQNVYIFANICIVLLIFLPFGLAQLPEHLTGFLLVNLGKLGVGWIFDTFWYGTEYFEESGPEMEISGRDLDFGGDGTGRKEEKWAKNRPEVWRLTFGTAGRVLDDILRFSGSYRYQNVDLWLIYTFPDPIF